MCCLLIHRPLFGKCLDIWLWSGCKTKGNNAIAAIESDSLKVVISNDSYILKTMILFSL